MIEVRPYRPEDRAAYVRLCEAHPGLNHMDPDNPVNPLTLLVYQDGELVAAGVAHMTMEGFITVDQGKGTKAEKWAWIQALVEGWCRWSVAHGYREVRMCADKGEKRWIERMLSLRGAKEDPRAHIMLDLPARYCDL